MTAISLSTDLPREEDLRLRALRGERRAQDSLYDQHAGWVYRLAFRMSGDADTASDHTQETFIRAYDRLATFRAESTFRTWLHSIALSVILGDIRTQQRRDTKRGTLDEAATLGHSDNHGDAALREKLYDAIEALPIGYRTVFVVYQIEGYSHQEIADALGVSLSTSQGQIFRARMKLRNALQHLVEERER